MSIQVLHLSQNLGPEWKEQRQWIQSCQWIGSLKSFCIPYGLRSGKTNWAKGVGKEAKQPTVADLVW